MFFAQCKNCGMALGQKWREEGETTLNKKKKKKKKKKKTASTITKYTKSSFPSVLGYGIGPTNCTKLLH